MTLKEFGISGYEEKVYVALIKNGPSSPRTISELSGVPPTAVYPAVKALVEEGIVLRLDTEQQRYEALPPKKALATLMRRRKKALERAQEESLSELESLEKNESMPAAPIILSRGSEASVDHSDDLSQTAKKTFFVLGWNFTRTNSAHYVVRRFRKLMKKNVKIKMLFTKKTAPGDILRAELDKLGVPYKFVKTGFISLVITDGARCKITLKHKDLGDRVNMLIDSPDLAEAMQQYYMKLWRSGKKSIE